jgi:hypothetical protein
MVVLVRYRFATLTYGFGLPFRPVSSPPPEAAEPGAGGPERLPVPLRPFTVADVLDGGVTALKVAPGQLVAVTAPFVIPVQVLSALAQRSALGGNGSVRDTFSAGSQGFGAGATLATVSVAALASLALVFAGAATATVVCSWYVERPVAPRAALGAVLRRAPALVALWFCVHVAEAIGAIGLLVGTVFVMPFFVAAAAVLAVEGLGPWTALRRSFGLTRRRYGFALGVVVMVAILDAVITAVVAVVGIVAQALVEATAGGLDLGSGWEWVIGVAITASASLVVVPFVGASAALVYLDLRVRNEGLDIELAAIEQFGVS